MSLFFLCRREQDCENKSNVGSTQAKAKETDAFGTLSSLIKLWASCSA